jgi:hypothetical protein
MLLRASWRTAMRVFVATLLCVGLGPARPVALAQSEFQAVGPSQPVKLPPEQKGAVKVTFDLVPTRMEFDLPAFPCMVTEIVPRTGRGPCELNFTLEPDEDMGAPAWIVNPAFVVKDWGESDVSLKVNSKRLRKGVDFRVGYEETATCEDLIIWVKMKGRETVKFSLAPQ